MSTVQLQDQGEFLNQLADEAERGQSVSLVRDGRVIAQIIPAPDTPRTYTDEERDAAWKRLSAIMEKGLDLGVWNGRDELYDRD